LCCQLSTGTRFSADGEAGKMQERIAALEAQLSDKEQIVAALTERLEQAAEQLDRLHRTGADRGMRIGGLPPELVEQQQKLVEDLERAVQQWEEMQPGAFLNRLEAQLSDIQEGVRRLESGDGEVRSSHSGHRSEEPPRSSSQSPKSILDFMKASMGAPAEAAGADEAAAAEPGAAAEQVVCHIPLPSLEDPPAPVDLAQASPEQLSSACEARDTYILYLLHRLRQIESLGHVPNSWAGLENAPEELRARLEDLEKRLQETLRLAEVELSLQRAKLAREEARIHSMDEQVQKELRRAREASDGQSTQGEDLSGSRWRRMLGRRPSDTG
jgi:chromosome segregation ATPase